MAKGRLNWKVLLACGVLFVGVVALKIIAGARLAELFGWLLEQRF